MATVNLETVLLAAYTDLSDVIELDVSAVGEQGGKRGEARWRANGRRVAVTQAGQKVEIPLTFDVVSDRALLATIRSWEGVLLLYRDPRGRKVWGLFWQPEIEENVAVDVATVSLTIVEISHSEAV
jgi:hypothetical protein